MQFLKKGLCALTFGMFCNEPLLKKGDKAPDFKLLRSKWSSCIFTRSTRKKEKNNTCILPNGQHNNMYQTVKKTKSKHHLTQFKKYLDLRHQR